MTFFFFFSTPDKLCSQLPQSEEKKKKTSKQKSISKSCGGPCQQRGGFGRDAACRLPAGVCVHNLPDLNAASCPAGCGEYSGPENSRLFPGRFGPKSPSRELGRRRRRRCTCSVEPRVTAAVSAPSRNLPGKPKQPRRSRGAGERSRTPAHPSRGCELSL